MSDYERTMAIMAQPDEVFGFVSDINNVPKYLPTVESATLLSADRIRIKGIADGKAYDDQGYFRLNRDSRRLEWGSDGDHNYSGWMQVEEGVEELFTARVIVHLSLELRPEMARGIEQKGGNADDAINESIDETLRSIKSLCESKDEKVESQSAT